MSRKAFFAAIATLLVFALISSNFQSATAFAQGTAQATPGEAENEACDPQTPNPAAMRLAQGVGVPASQIMAWHCKGKGFGEIRKAYVLAELTKGPGMTALSVEQIFAMRDGGKGWGQIVKSTGLSMKDFNKALRDEMKLEKGKGKNKPKDKQNGNDNEKGNGKGKGKGKGNNGDDQNDNEKDDDD
jgi:hypothetical protein